MIYKHGKPYASPKGGGGGDTGGGDTGSGDTTARPNVVSNINSNLMVQDKATKRWIPLQFDATGGTGITVTLSGGAFRDAEGLPANVASAAAYGTSAFAARRDHVHTIAALTVTNAMIANTTIDLTAKVTGLLPMANGGSAANLTPSNGGIVYSSGTAMAILAGTATAGKILASQSSAAPVWSTPTFPTSASATSGKTIRSDGTNWVASTATLSDAPSTALKWLRSDGTNWITSTATLAEGAVTSGKILVSDGTNWVASTPTFPNSSATARAILRGDGTNWVISTTAATDDTLADVILGASATTQKPLVLQGKASQTADILQVQNSAGTPIWATGCKSVTGANNQLSGLGVAATLTTGTGNCLFGASTDTNASGTTDSIAVGRASKGASTSVIIGAAKTSSTTNDLIIETGDCGIRRVAAKVIEPTDGAGTGAWIQSPAGSSRVTSQFDKAANTTLASVPGLSWTLQSGRIYAFDITVFITSDTTGGYKIDLNGGGVTVTSINYWVTNSTGGTVSSSIGRNTSISTNFGVATPANANIVLTFKGVVVVNSGASPLSVEFAQNSASGTSSVLVGSFGIFTDVP